MDPLILSSIIGFAYKAIKGVGEGITTEGVTSGPGLTPYYELERMGEEPLTLEEKMAGASIAPLDPSSPLGQWVQEVLGSGPIQVQAGPVAVPPVIYATRAEAEAAIQPPPDEGGLPEWVLPVGALVLGGLVLGTVTIGGIAYVYTR